MDGAIVADVNSYGRESPASSAGRIASLGPEGAYIELSDDYPVGCSLGVRFKLPPSFSTIGCSAIVRSRNVGRGVGVEFTDLMPADRERIKEFVAWGSGKVRRVSRKPSTIAPTGRPTSG